MDEITIGELTVRDVSVTKDLWLIDEDQQDKGAIHLSVLDDGQSAITLFGDSNAEDNVSFIYEAGGWIILSAGDGTYFCLGDSSAGLCEVDDSGTLQLVE